MARIKEMAITGESVIRVKLGWQPNGKLKVVVKGFDLEMQDCGITSCNDACLQCWLKDQAKDAFLEVLGNNCDSMKRED